MAETNLDKIVARLAVQTSQPEATTQADIYALLTEANIGLDDETVTTKSPVEDDTKRRIDVEIGQCVIEVKKNLQAGDLPPKAEEQHGGYTKQPSDALERYVVQTILHRSCGAVAPSQGHRARHQLPSRPITSCTS